MDKRRLYTLIDEIFPLVKNISFVPETEELPVSNMEMHRLYSENLVVISVKNNLSRWYNQFFKRAFDLSGSATVGTIAISPILLGSPLPSKPQVRDRPFTLIGVR